MNFNQHKTKERIMLERTVSNFPSPQLKVSEFSFPANQMCPLDNRRTEILRLDHSLEASFAKALRIEPIRDAFSNTDAHFSTTFVTFEGGAGANISWQEE